MLGAHVSQTRLGASGDAAASATGLRRGLCRRPHLAPDGHDGLPCLPLRRMSARQEKRLATYSICDLLVLRTPSVRVHCRKERQSHPEQESENKARTRLQVLLFLPSLLPYLPPGLSYHLAATARSLASRRTPTRTNQSVSPGASASTRECGKSLPRGRGRSRFAGRGEVKRAFGAGVWQDYGSRCLLPCGASAWRETQRRSEEGRASMPVNSR